MGMRILSRYMMVEIDFGKRKNGLRVVPDDFIDSKAKLCLVRASRFSAAAARISGLVDDRSPRLGFRKCSLLETTNLLRGISGHPRDRDR